MRVKVVCHASAGSKRFIIPVPQYLELVADLAKHLQLRLPDGPQKLILRLSGFALLPTLRLLDVLRDNDELTVSAAEDSWAPCQAESTLLASAEKRQKGNNGSAIGHSAIEDVHDSPKAKRKMPPYPPTPSPSPADVVQGKTKMDQKASNQVDPKAKKPQKLAKAHAGEAAKAPVVTSAAAASAARKVLEQSSPDEDVSQARFVSHPLLGDLEVLPGQKTDEFLNRKLKTLRKAIRKQVEHYFGDTNWPKDAHLQSMADSDGFVLLEGIADFSLLKQLCTDLPTIRESLEASQVVELSDCKARLRKRGLMKGWQRTGEA
mmetsp:Transcript_6373/g.11642  ORF Transcript_6373/g.11642 Transcript_6373/m.11642 type:complete len:319 (+) Transcript_6373:27-983(+)